MAVLFSSARFSKVLNVDHVRPPNDDSHNVTQIGSSGDDLQAFIDEFDSMISNQDVIRYTILTHTHIHILILYICVYVTL